MKNKHIKFILLITLSITLIACTKKENDYIIFGINNSINLEYLNKCLHENNIDFKIDKEKNILIKSKDNEKAVIYCS